MSNYFTIKNKLIILWLSFLPTTVMAETMLLIEQTDKQLIFVSSNKKEPDFQYYAVWSNKQNSCITKKPANKPFPLKEIMPLYNVYSFPNKSGFLCLRRSKDLLPKEWNKYQVFIKTILTSKYSNNRKLIYMGNQYDEATIRAIENQTFSSISGESIIINQSINTHSEVLNVDKKEIKISAVALSPETLKKESNLLECKLREEKGYSFCQIKL